MRIVIVVLLIVLGLGISSLAADCRLKSDPLIPGIGSLIIPGVGQVLNGEDVKGLTHLVVAVALPSVILIASNLLYPMAPSIAGVLSLAAPLLYLGWAVNSAVDAYQVSLSRCHG
jgi:hypothetical protein